jgi:hypothetical protein
MMIMYKIKYKPEKGPIVEEKFKSLQKFKEALIYMTKCSDIDLRKVWFGCISCGTWICYFKYKPQAVVNKLKNPLKREAFFYCKECANQTVNIHE